MTTLSLPERVENGARHAAATSREVKFSRFVLIVIAGLFYMIGWLAGGAWRGVVFSALMIRQGFREGAGVQAIAEQPVASP